MKARVHIMLKNGVLDPQGDAVRHALGTLGFNEVESVRQGKVIELEVKATNPVAAAEQIRNMCEKLLVNTVIETYKVEFV